MIELPASSTEIQITVDNTDEETKCLESQDDLYDYNSNDDLLILKEDVHLDDKEQEQKPGQQKSLSTSIKDIVHMMMINRKKLSLLFICSVGFFVDVLDLQLFAAVRISCLQSFDLPPDELLNKGILLLNIQQIGLFIGGIFFGIMGDKLGRAKSLFSSIFLYSIGNIASAMVTSLTYLAILRFIVGFGLSGELGTAITLVTETLGPEKRGFGTTMIVCLGGFGAMTAGIMAKYLHWRTSFFLAGVMGLMILLLRISSFESEMFEKSKIGNNTPYGDIRMLLYSKKRSQRYIRCVILGVSIWFVLGVLISFSPEIGMSIGVHGKVEVSQSLFYGFMGAILGDFSAGLLSQVLKSRRKVLLIFICGTAISTYIMLSLRDITLFTFYCFIFLTNFMAGYWVLLVTIAAESFGTNIRSTVTTTVPNVVRATAIIWSGIFGFLFKIVGARYSALITGSFTFILALLALKDLPETFGKDIDYLEYTDDK